MATLSALYSTPNPFGSLLNMDDAGSDARVDAGLQTSRLLSDFGNRYLPDVQNRYASRGTLYGGQIGAAVDRTKGEVANQQADIQRALDRQLSYLRRQGILAATGVGL